MLYTYFVVDCDLAARHIKESELDEWKEYPDARVFRTAGGVIEAFHYKDNDWKTHESESF